MAEIVRITNKVSQNMYAEALLKRIAAARTRQPGSWLTGAAIIRHTFHERGITKVNQMVIHDGSGLSRQNRLTTELLVRWLNSFHHDDQLGDTFINSLAEAGVSGTMERRMMNIDLHDTRVHAKTGYINRVSCLSGYVTASDGRRRSFAIMINDLKSPVSEAKALQDRIVGAIAADLARTPSRLGSD